MNLKRFIREEKLTIIFNLAILLCTNLYYIVLNSVKYKKGDLIYLDIMLIFIYFLWFFIKYKIWKKRYDELYSYAEENENIEAVDNEYIAEEIISQIISRKEETFRKRELEYQQQINDMEEYISKWVHEIKLPISTLNIIIERIEDDTISSNIKNETEKINFLVNSVMYGSRTTASAEDIFIVEEKLDLIVKNAVRNNSFFLIKNNIEISLKNLEYRIYTDRKWILYVLDQIINNDIKYCDENGKIEFYGVDEGNYIALNIKDNGIGIAEEDIERIFNKGFTGKNGRNSVYKSTGMGLYFSYKILKKLGHGIEVESVEGEYTLFRIKFNKISDYMNVAKM